MTQSGASSTQLLIMKLLEPVQWDASVIPGTQKTEAEGLQIQDRPQQLRKTPPQKGQECSLGLKHQGFIFSSEGKKENRKESDVKMLMMRDAIPEIIA